MGCETIKLPHKGTNVNEGHWSHKSGQIEWVFLHKFDKIHVSSEKYQMSPGKRTMAAS